MTPDANKSGVYMILSVAHLWLLALFLFNDRKDRAHFKHII